MVKLLAGTQNRVVHTLDIVPALPPLKNYSATDYGRWISKNATTVLEVRHQQALMLKVLSWLHISCRSVILRFVVMKHLLANLIFDDTCSAAIRLLNNRSQLKHYSCAATTGLRLQQVQLE